LKLERQCPTGLTPSWVDALVTMLADREVLRRDMKADEEP
jgi:hypothetical protein